MSVFKSKKDKASNPAEAVTSDMDKQAKSKVKKKRIITAVAVVAAIAVVGAAASRFIGPSAKKTQTGEVQYSDVAVEKRDLTVTLSGSGTIQPANSYTVTSLVEGEILSDEFEEGDIVYEDTVLYNIDSSDAAATLEKAQMSFEQSQRSYENTLESIADLNIKADYTGIITELMVEEGDTVNAGQTVASFRDIGTMVLKLPFSADDAVNIHKGDTAVVTLDSSFETLYGTVTKVSGVDDISASNMITRNVTIEVANPGALGLNQAATAMVGDYACAAAGTFQYRKEGNITAKTSGEVSEIYVGEGGEIYEGKVIMALSSDDIDDKIQSAEDSLRNAELSYESQMDILDNYTITSPIEGTVIEKYYKAGDNISDAGRTLCVIYDLSYMEITLNIDELDIGKVSEGQKVKITAEAAGDKVYEGEITKVSIQGATAGGITVYPATIRIDETEGLLPGMNADIEIVIESTEDALTVPVSAVNRNGTVLVKGEGASPEGMTAPEGYHYVEVKTGMTTDDYIEITEGLNEGDMVGIQQRTSSSTNTGIFGIGGMGEMPQGGMPSGGDFQGGGMPSGGNFQGGSMPSGGNFPSGGGMPSGGGGMPR